MTNYGKHLIWAICIVIVVLAICITIVFVSSHPFILRFEADDNVLKITQEYAKISSNIYSNNSLIR